MPATLALYLGLAQLVDRHLDLGDAPGRANTGDKMMTLGMFLRSFAEPRSRSATPPRGLAGKPSAGFCHYAKQTYYSRIRRDSVCNTFQDPIITSVIDAKKITAWGESGFPARFLAGVPRRAAESTAISHAKNPTPSVSMSAPRSGGEAALRMAARQNTVNDCCYIGSIPVGGRIVR